MMGIDYFYGVVTGRRKMINICQACGLQRELHGSGWANMQLACAVPEATCEYYERGLLRPGLDDSRPEPYLTSIADPMDGQGNVTLSKKPGLGFEVNRDYIDDNRLGP